MLSRESRISSGLRALMCQKRSVGNALMNRVAKQLGLNSSNFGTSNGWPDNGVTYVTAHDLAKLASATITNHPQLYKQFYAKRD